MKKRLIPILLSVIFILSSFMTITAFAANPASQDGLTAALTSSKTAYAANEDIDVSLMVINNNAYAVDGIKTAITLPDGVTAKAGSLSQNAFSLAAGESKTSTPTIVKAVTITPPKDDNTANPQTGNSSNLAIWLTIMLVSGGALVFLAIKNKKIKSKGVLSLFLCFAILGTIGLPISANAASTQKSFTVTEDLTVDGKAVTVSAEISYGYIAHNSVTVTDGTGSATYAEGDTVTITANAPQSGYHFTGWTVVSGDVSLANATDGTTTFTMPDKAVEIKANYEINTYTITATTDSNGAVSPAGAITVNHGDSKKFDFAANEGYHIKDVTVDGTSVGAVPSYTFDDVTVDHTISVTFEIDTFTISATAEANGTVTPTGTTNVSYGGTQTYTITPNNGYHIVDIIVDGVSKGVVGTYTFDDVKANHSISATFAINTYTITATTDSNGAVSPEGSITVNYGNSKMFDFTANEGYHIKDVLVDGTSVGTVSSYTFDNVTDNHTISVTFEIDTFTVTVNNGSVQGGTNTVAWGEEITIVADTPSSDKEFKDWTVVSGEVTLADSTQATTIFTMPKSNVEVTANYADKKVLANAEAAKITGITSGTNNINNLVFNLTGYNNLSSEVSVNLVSIKTGSSSANAAGTDVGASISGSNLSLNTNKTVDASDLTYVGLVYTVTFNGTTSDEKEIDVSELFSTGTTTDKLRTSKAVIKGADWYVIPSGDVGIYTTTIIMCDGVSIPKVQQNNSFNGSEAIATMSATNGSAVIVEITQAAIKRSNLPFKEFPMICNGTSYIMDNIDFSIWLKA